MSDMTTPRSASEWIALLNDDPDNRDLRVRHDAWLESSAENRADWDETLRVWQMLDMTVPVHVAEWQDRIEQVQPIVSRKDRVTVMPGANAGPMASVRRRGGSPFWPRQLSLGLSGCALVACLLVFALPGWMIGLNADYLSPTGEMRVVELPDGSMLHLAPDSAVALAFAGDKRQIELLRGEAFLDVVPMTDRPFRVISGETETTVLGTAFDVRRGEYGVDVAVEHGRVRVEHTRGSAPDNASELGAGDMVHVDPNGSFVRQTIVPELVAAWRGGRLIAKDQSVAEIVETVDRYFDGWILISDDALAREPLTGIYNLEDPKAALAAIADAQGAILREISPWVLMLSPE
ncbi:FecR domain-containing protein [Thalassospiraceae bacterium SW-3-3]|nr:FecR domain-containing protein [Thalassospiraceae bacterium SW-3-3]